MLTGKTLDPFQDTHQDICLVEKNVLRERPRTAHLALAENSRGSFLQHRGKTEGQVELLVEIFGKPVRYSPMISEAARSKLGDRSANPRGFRKKTS